jgi:hypothetical protein
LVGFYSKAMKPYFVTPVYQFKVGDRLKYRNRVKMPVNVDSCSYNQCFTHTLRFVTLTILGRDSLPQNELLKSVPVLLASLLLDP